MFQAAPKTLMLGVSCDTWAWMAFSFSCPGFFFVCAHYLLFFQFVSFSVLTDFAYGFHCLNIDGVFKDILYVSCYFYFIFDDLALKTELLVIQM